MCSLYARSKVTISQSHDLELIDFELEKTLRSHRHIASKVKIEDKLEMDLEQQPQAPQEKPFKEYFSPLTNLTMSCIKYANVTARSFELKHTLLNCLLLLYRLENEDL